MLIHTYSTPEPETIEILKKVHTDREKGITWKEICKKHKRSRSFLAPYYRWYVKTQIGGAV